MDENMYCLWSIERIEEEISEYYPKGNVIIDFIPICDYLFHSHQVGYMTTKKGLFKDYIPNEEKICEGFNDFLDLLLQNENILY